MKIVFILSCLSLLLFSCKKAGDRQCLKSFGAPATLEIPLDSVYQFCLYKNITYHVFQDTLRKVVVKGGTNTVNFVKVSNVDHVLSITNENKCQFLRDFEQKITVEIHYPFLYKFYSETNDSLIFHDTISASQLHIEQSMGGGGVRAHVNVTELVMAASHGVGNFKVSGNAGTADLRVQTDGSGDATALVCPFYLLDQNSTQDLLVNLEGATASIAIKGTGNVIYTGTPDSLNIIQKGDGAVIQK